MKNNLYANSYAFLLACLFLIPATIWAQLPNAPKADYSTKTGTFTDTRDGKTYAYKKYGDYEWFIQNLNYVAPGDRGTSPFGSYLYTPGEGYGPNIDPDGSIFGRMYNIRTSTADLDGFCPEGWRLPVKSDWEQFFTDIISEYELTGVTATDISKYLKSGGTKADGGLWAIGTEIDAKSDQIGFNILPAGVLNYWRRNDTGYDNSTQIDPNTNLSRGDHNPGDIASFMLSGWKVNAFKATDNKVLFPDNAGTSLLMYSHHYGSVRCIRKISSSSDTEITTPYPEVIEVKQIRSTEYEIKRLRQVQKKFDHQLTGFYVREGAPVVVNVETLTAAADGATPKLVIGTPRRPGNERREFSLKEGANMISGTAHKGGMIYFRYVSNTASPQGKIKVTFADGSEHQRAPHYIKGITTADEFNSMLDIYTTPDVMFSTDYAAVVVSPAAAKKYSVTTDKEAWLASIDRILRVEDEISGLSNDDPNPLHHRLADGIRYLFAEVPTGYMYATNFVTGYCGDAALARLLTNNQIDKNSWGVSHELGHQHQQGSYKPGTFTETTVNIYSIAVQRDFWGANFNKFKQEAWDALHTKYFTLPDGTRNLHNNSINVYQNVNESRLMLIEQLRIIFGDEFYHRLHRITREEEVSGGSDADRQFYFVLKACQLTGYDLRDYFHKWGIQLGSYNQSILDKAVTDAGLQEPFCIDELHMTTSFYEPACLPLPLIGITTSEPQTDPQPQDGVASVNKYCDYSTKTGNFTDPRDGKVYPYKKYGTYDWFMRNLDWDGYDGVNESTRGSVGLYGKEDPTGELYGRYYPTNAVSASANWCPEGWQTPTSTLWNDLMQSIQTEYNVDASDLGACLKSGGDRDVQEDGLWAKGPGSILVEKAAQVGFNALPAGVFNKTTYEENDIPGLKASFLIPSSTWYHKVLWSSSDNVSYPNRNSIHHGSVRCVRQAQIINTSVEEAQQMSKAFFNASGSILTVVSSLPVKAVSVFDITGRAVFHKQIDQNQLTLEVESNSLNKGIYIIKVQNSSGFESLKVSK